MAGLKTVTVHVAKSGEVRIETSGFTGSECTKATKELEESLGTVTDRTMKPEAQITNTSTNTVKATS